MPWKMPDSMEGWRELFESMVADYESELDDLRVEQIEGKQENEELRGMVDSLRRLNEAAKATEKRNALAISAYKVEAERAEKTIQALYEVMTKRGMRKFRERWVDTMSGTGV